MQSEHQRQRALAAISLIVVGLHRDFVVSGLKAPGAGEPNSFDIALSMTHSVLVTYDINVIEFYLDRSSGLSPYLQLMQQVRQALRVGLLEPGEQLPTVRAVVGQLAINPNTVLKAYRGLEYEGLVEGRPGLGTFVVDSLVAPPPGTYSRLRRSLRRWLDDAQAAGLDDASIVGFVTSTLRDAAEERVA